MKTSNARSKIRRWLKQAGLDQSIALGREIVERKLKQLHVAIPGEEELQGYAEQLNKKTVEDLLAAIGNGSMTARPLLSRIVPEEEKVEPGFVGKDI